MGLRSKNAVRLFHKDTAAQDTLIAHPLFSAPVKIPDSLPTSRAAAQTAPLQLRSAASYKAFGNILAIATPRSARLLLKSTKHFTDRLPRPGRSPHDGAMAGPRISIERVQIADGLGPKRVYMDVSYQLQQIRLFFHEDGLVPVLEEVTGTLVASIERPGVSR